MQGKYSCSTLMGMFQHQRSHVLLCWYLSIASRLCSIARFSLYTFIFDIQNAFSLSFISNHHWCCFEWPINSCTSWSPLCSEHHGKQGSMAIRKLISHSQRTSAGWHCGTRSRPATAVDSLFAHRPVLVTRHQLWWEVTASHNERQSCF
jgi:hypothetical protein